MDRRSIRDNIKIEEVLEHEEGWFEVILYDADLATRQELLEEQEAVKGYLYLIHPVIIEAQK